MFGQVSAFTLLDIGKPMIFEDVRFALRHSLKNPAFTTAAVLSLALGIGANTAIFSIVNAVLRHPAGVDQPGRVAMMYVRYQQFGLDVPYISIPDYADAGALKDAVAESAIETDTAFNIIRNASSQHLSAAQVSWRWFQVFGAKPILGRTFTREEDQPGASSVAVLSYALWQSEFAGQSDVLGQTIELDQRPYRVVGVMRSDFDWPRGKQIWVPIAVPPKEFATGNRFNENFQCALRLQPGVSVERLNAVYSTTVRQKLVQQGTSTFAASSGWSVYASPLTDFAAGSLKRPLYVLFAVVVLVLLIASANVAGLSLARISTRSREFAIRMALGANAAALTRQVMIETLLLSLAATAIGIAAGPFLGKLLLISVPHNLAEGFDIQLEPVVLAFSAAAGLLTCFIAGVGPAVQIIRSRNNSSLHETGRSITDQAGKQRMRSAFVIGEVSLALLLLTATGIFLVSFQKLQQVNPGFNPHGVLAARVVFSGEDFRKSTAQQATYIQSTIASLQTLPGVQSVAAIQPLPFADGKESGSFAIEGHPNAPNDPGPHSQQNLVTAGYLKVMQIPLIKGRWFTDSDTAATQPVAVINVRLARHYWPGQNPIGQRIRNGSATPWATVVGIVSNIRFDSLEDDTSDGMLYYPFAQQNGSFANFVIRGTADPNSLIEPVQRAIAEVNATQTASEIRSMDFLVASSLSGRRLLVWMLGAFATVALLLAAIGIYALISYITAQRTVEVGVRMALGAQRREVLGLVLRGSMLRILIGLALGAVLSVAATDLLQHFFSGMESGFAMSLSLSAIMLALAGAVASAIPAARAASINPIRALRNE